MKSTNLLLVCPSYDQRLFTQTAFSIVETIVTLREMKVPVTLRYLAGDAIVNRVRNGAVAEFLARKDATHLLFVDSDMQFSPRTILRLLKADVPFACAAYAKKTYRNLPTRTVQPRDLKGFQEASMVWNVVLHETIPQGRSRPGRPRGPAWRTRVELRLGEGPADGQLRAGALVEGGGQLRVRLGTAGVEDGGEEATGGDREDHVGDIGVGEAVLVERGDVGLTDRGWVGRGLRCEGNEGVVHPEQRGT